MRIHRQAETFCLAMSDQGLTADDMEGLTWDWDKGKWVRRVDPEGPLIPEREDKSFNYDRDWPGWRGALKQIQPNHSGGDPWFAHEPGESFENLPEAFIPNPRFITPETALAGWVEGDPTEVGPEDEREWREIKFRPGRGFYHPDTDEDAGEYEWAHARPDRKMLVSRERR